MYIKKKLTEQQDLFCLEFIVDLNGTQAAIRAKYSEKTAQEQASRLLSNVMVQDRIQELKKKRSEKVTVSAEKTIEEISRIAFSNITNYWKQANFGSIKILTFKELENMHEGASSAIAGIKQIVRGKEIVFEIKLWDKVRALEILCRHLGIAKEQVQHGVDAASLVSVAKEVIKLREEAGK